MNIDYLAWHVSHELHTFVRRWSGELKPDNKPEIFCARKDLKDDYFSFSEFEDYMNQCLAGKFVSACPVVFSAGLKENQVAYAYLQAGDFYYLVGPVRFDSKVRLYYHIGEFEIPKSDFNAVFSSEFYFFCSNILLLCNLFRKEILTRDDIVYENCEEQIRDSEIMEEYSALIFERQELEEPHNPYEQEIRELTSIELGDIEMLKKSIGEDYLGKTGVLSKDELRNTKNLGIVVMTLASRAAIRGGLMPEISYSMSDVFIQKIEEMTDIVAIYTAIRQFEMEYAKLVAEIRKQDEKKSKEKQSIWVEASKEYIFKHLHEKIRVQEIADYLHLNSSYLSELFKQQESMTLTDFILQEKVKLTKNLLTYSPYSYIEIATYLGFSSQSHLGKVFKKYTDMTLRQYRERYGREQIQERRKAELISNE